MNNLHFHHTARWPLVLVLLSTIVALGTLAPAAQPARASSIAPAISVSADITINTLWTAANSPYIVTLPINVANTATLTIEPGVEVRFAAGAGMVILGGLAIQGTQAQQVRMVGDNGATWLGITAAQPAGNLLIQSATIRNALAGLAIHQVATTGGKANARVDVLDSLFENNVIGINADYSITTNAPRLTMRNNLLTNNQIGMQINGIPGGNIRPKFNHNSFTGNGIGVNALNVNGAGLKMKQHWWGSSSGPIQGTTATCLAPPAPGTNARDTVCGNVDFTPWTRTPSGRMLVPAGQGATLESALGQAALSDDDSAPTSVMTLTVPVGTFTQTVDLLAAERIFPTPPPGRPTQLNFEVTAAANGQEIHRFANGRQLTLTIDYTAADLAGVDPSTLVVYYFDEAAGGWSRAGISTTPDPANHRLIVHLSHLSRFSVTSAGGEQIVLLPMIMR